MFLFQDIEITDEHCFQKEVVRGLRFMGFIVLGTDVMDGLKFLGRKEKSRIAFINHHNQMGYTKGQPDLIVIAPNGKITFAEFKTTKGKQSPEQKKMQKCLEEKNLNYVVWRSYRQINEFIKSFERAEKTNVMGEQCSLSSPAFKEQRI